MISTELMGGLGNQLFQIFNVLAYSLRYKKEVIFPKDKSDSQKRPDYWQSFFKSIGYLVGDESVRMKVLREPSFEFNGLGYIEEDFMFYGYFQSYKYFEDQQDSIYKLIRIDKHKQNVIEKVNMVMDNTVSIHFRLGDYKGLSEYHPILTIDYYIKALLTIIQKTKNKNLKVIYFFEQEDVDQVNTIIDTLKTKMPSINFTPVLSDLLDYEQMIFMSLCQHNIIANSSFSWWGAYLNNNPNKIVCYPSVWFGPKFSDKNTKDLCPNYWNKIMC